MLSWLHLAPIFVCAFVVLFVPGFVFSAVLGFRKLTLLAVSAPVSAGLLGILAIVLGLIHVRFAPIPVAISLIIVWAIAALARFLILRFDLRWLQPIPEEFRNEGFSHRVTGWIVLGLCVAFPIIVIAIRYMHGMGTPDSISQTFDDIYHLNATKYIAETGNGSSLTIGNLTDASRGFYPAALHDAMGLVAATGHFPIPETVNATSILIGALVWPLSCLFLTTRIAGNTLLTVAATAVLCAGFSYFPYSMVAFGVLYPFHYGLALLPVGLGLVIMCIRPNSLKAPLGATLLITLVSFCGLALAHPSVLIAVLLFAIPILIAKNITVARGVLDGLTTRKSLLTWLIASIIYLGVTVLVFIKARPSLGSAGWLPTQSNAQAIGEILGAGPMGGSAAWLIMVLTIIGFYCILRNFARLWWVGAIYLIGAILYIVVSGFNAGPVRNFITGVWYADPPRLGAMLPITTIPVTVLGAVWVLRKLMFLVSTRRSHIRGTTVNKTYTRATHASTLSAAVCIVLLCIFAFGSQGGALKNVQNRLTSIFRTTPDSYLVNTDEQALLNMVKDYVPAGERVVGDPLTGSSLVYALGDREALAPHVFGPRSDDEELVLDHWDEAAYNSKVCAAVNRLHAHWALDFGTDQVPPGDHEKFINGVRDLTTDTAPGVQEVAKVGNARLFKLTGCS